MSNVTNTGPGAGHHNGDVVRYEDIAGLKSRVSWAAILGGAVFAIAVYTILTQLFLALGLSLNDADNLIRGDNPTWTIGAVLAVVTIVLAMFAGGWVTTQLTAGETKQEAVVHGILTWAAVTALTLAMIGMGARAGFNALLGASYVASNQVDAANWEATARRAGYTQQQIDEFKRTSTPTEGEVRATAEQTRQYARNATWAALAGTILSVGAAIGGALVGAGPTLRLFPTTVVHAHRREVLVSR